MQNSGLRPAWLCRWQIIQNVVWNAWRFSWELRQRSQSVLPLRTAAFRFTVGGCCWEGYSVGKTVAKLPEVEVKFPTSPCNMYLSKLWSRTGVSLLHQKKAAWLAKQGASHTNSSVHLTRSCAQRDCAPILTSYEEILTSTTALTTTSVNSCHNWVGLLQASTAIDQAVLLKWRLLVLYELFSLLLKKYYLHDIVSLYHTSWKIHKDQPTPTTNLYYYKLITETDHFHLGHGNTKEFQWQLIQRHKENSCKELPVLIMDTVGILIFFTKWKAEPLHLPCMIIQLINWH